MTVSTPIARNDYLSSGITGPYPFTFPIKAASHLVVTKRYLSTGAETTLVQGVDYTLAGTTWINGGSFTLASLLVTGYTLTARRVVPLTQLLDLRNQGAFFAEDHESEFDLLVMADQQQQDQLDRSLKLPTTEAGTAAKTVFPGAELRANKGVGFDSTGQLLMIDPTSPAAVTASGTLTVRTLSERFAEVFNVKDFGAIGDGVADDTAAFAAGIAALTSGKALYVPPGTFNLNSATLSGALLTIGADNVAIYGAGRHLSKLVLTGTTVCASIFRAICKNNIEIHDLWFYGNNQASGFINGIALAYHNTGATAAISGFHIRNCRFDNFKGDSWIYVENLDGNYGISDIIVTDCYFYSYSGNSREPTNVAIPQGCVGIWAHNANVNGWVKHVRIDRNEAYCKYMKGLAQVFGNVQRFSISHNKIFEVGTDAAFTDDSACYSIICYNNFLPPRYGTIMGNQVINCRDTGMYLLGCIDMTVIGNWIFNQTSTADSTLAKAGIVIGEGARYVCMGNTVHQSRCGIYFQGTGSALEPVHDSVIANNVIRSSARAGIKVEAGPTRPLDGLTISGNMVHDGTVHGIWVDIQSTTNSKRLTIANNDVRASQIGIFVTSGDSSWKLADARITGNHIRDCGTSHMSVRNWNVGPIVIDNNHMHGNSSPSCDIRDNSKLVFTNNCFYDVNSGNYCIYSANAQGIVFGNQFNNVSPTLKVLASGSEDLGLDAPTWTGSQGQRVQFCDPQSTSGNALLGWVYTSSGWVEERAMNLSGSATYDPPSLADGAGATTTVTVTGAALGDFAEASFSLDLQGITVTAWVSAANTVSVRFQNESGGVLDLASGTLRARVRKQ